ncbi:ATP-binding protein [Brevundimonas variabilis]|uniref:histidine kinase n=1 Tax=Brevundimonas variabilis TaxID=74312 RepID=A0A7W9CKL1_9CAUL|nr:ATP-binding protein [Brevundimonas variabilis]MBB5747337.1 signal transduction histidine kinase/ActR/RegA family two-component response regulator [Brevundimonas variabilis]
MARIGDHIEASLPVLAETYGSVVFDRFQAEPNTLAIAVVDDENRPLGLVERNAFCLQMAAEFGRALYARRPISALMDCEPLLVEADAGAETFFRTIDAAELGALLRGFIVVSEGRYVGVGTALQVLQAGSALYRRRAEEMSELARNLAAAEAEAQASSRAKSEFLAVMSHEIRTPLNGVLGVAGLLDRKLEQPELRRYVHTILESGQSLLRLLTDALDMSRASAGMLGLVEAPFDIDALGADVDALWRARADEKGLALKMICDTADQAWVVGDTMRLKQLLNNLIGNALKFTQAGEVVVRLATRRDAELGMLRLEATVDDSGPGIPASAAATIFEPFNTGNAGREGAGAGLGLAICRQIVEQMGGTITVSQSPRMGARFQFSLPVIGADATARVAEPVMAAPTPHETLHVLVVDDNATNRFVAGKLLEMFGCTFESVEDGAQAVEAVSSRPFDLVLMDIKMPVMDGIAATRAIRKLPGPQSTLPIVALTANAEDGDAATYLAAGMNGVAQKPIQPDALLNVIRTALTPVLDDEPVRARAA